VFSINWERGGGVCVGQNLMKTPVVENLLSISMSLDELKRE